MADKLFIKHNLGSFQQPYIFQAPANNRLPFIRQTPAPYPYIANKQEPNIRQQPAPYPYIANNQEPNIRQQPAPYTYPASQQEPNIRRTPAPYPYIANAQNPFIRQQPAPYPYIANAQTPNIRQQPAPYPYIANNQEPNIRQEAVAYPYIANAQQPVIRQQPAPYPYIANAQEPNIRRTPAPYPYIANAQQPLIRQTPAPYSYQASQQEPNIRNAQQPVIRDQQEPNIRRTPAPYPYIANSQEPNIRRTPAPYPYIANKQQPNIRNAQQPYPFIGNSRVSINYSYQSPFTYPFIGNSRNPFTYSYRSPAAGDVGENLNYITTGTATDIFVADEQFDTYSGSTIFIGGTNIELHMYVIRSGDTLTLYARGQNSGDDSRYLVNANGTQTNIPISSGLQVAQFTFTSTFNPSHMRFVIENVSETHSIDDNPNNVSHLLNYDGSSYATTDMSSNIVSSSSASGNYATYSSSLNGGFELRYNFSASFSGGGFASEGSQSATKIIDLSLQFSRPNSNAIVTSAPIRIELESGIDMTDEGFEEGE